MRATKCVDHGCEELLDHELDRPARDFHEALARSGRHPELPSLAVALVPPAAWPGWSKIRSAACQDTAKTTPWSTVCLSTCWTTQTQHGPQLCTWNAGVYDGYGNAFLLM